MEGQEHVLVCASLHGGVCRRERCVDLLAFPNDSFSKTTLRLFCSQQTNPAAVGPDSCITTKQQRGLGGTQSCTSHLQSHFSTVVVLATAHLARLNTRQSQESLFPPKIATDLCSHLAKTLFLLNILPAQGT